MAKNCIIPSDFRKEHGFSDNFFKSIRKSADKVNLSKRQVRNLVKNLGIDDARAIELRKGKGHIFGRNLKKIEEFDASKGKVPKDTLVKKRNKDGLIDYFVSERKTDMSPSKWVVDDGEVKPNTDWTYVGKNATTNSSGALKKFKKLKNGTFKEDPEGDTFLKVGKIYDGDNPPPNAELAEQGYDAVRLNNGNLRVLSKPHQEINPEQVFIRDTKRSVGKTATKNEPNEEEIAKELESLGLGTRVAATLAGGIAGNIAAEDYGGTWLGGAIGLALSMPSVRNGIKGIVKGSDKTVDDITGSLAEAQRKGEEFAELTEDGYRGHPLDEEAKQTFKEQWLNEVERLKNRGQDIWKTIFGSSYLRSGISDFANMGIREAKKLFNVLQRTETAHNVYMSDAVQVINRRFGQNTSIPDFQDMQASVIRDYIDSVPALKNQGFLERDDDFFLQEMGASIRRIITHGAELDNQGQLVLRGDDDLAQRVYSEQPIRDQDRFILQHDQGRNLVEAHREIFDKMGDRTVDSLQKAIDDLAEEFTSEEARVFNSFLSSGKSVKQWETGLSDGMRELYESVKSSDVFREAVQFRGQQLKIKNLKGNYIPQVQDSEKLAKLKQDFLRSNKRNGKFLINHDAQTQDMAWSRHFTKKIVAHNNDDFTVKGLSASGEDIETMYFGSFKKALNDLRNEYVGKITDRQVRIRVRQQLESDDPVVWDKYIGQTDVNGKQVYYLKNNPDLEHNIVRDMSQESVDQAQRMFINMAMMKQSNFLDNPRNFILPENMLQNNMTKVINQYSRDVGVRSHLMQNGLGTQRGLKNTLDEIRMKLKDKGVTDVEKKMQRTQEWYATITRTKNNVEVNQSPSKIIADRRRMKRNNKVARTVMNFAAMPFMWFTSFYAPFTPAILGSYLSSPKSIAKTYGEVLRDPQALKSMTDNLYKYGALQKKLRSISEEAQYGDYSAEGLAGGGNSIDWLYNMSQKGIDFSTRFSSMKGIMNRMSFLPDVDDAGILRLTTGDLYDISGAESAMVNMAVFKELEDMTEAGKQIIDARRAGKEALEGTSSNGKSFRLGTVRRKLEELGVDNPDRFIEESAKVTEDMTNTKRFYNELTGQGDEAPVSGYLRNEYSRIMDTVINQYHGRTKFTRPLKWVDNVYGRVLSQFSVYAQNFGVQTVRRRIYQPIKDWTDTYDMKEDTPLYKVWWHMQRGNDNRLKKIFGEDNWQAAYDDFPVDAADAMFKVTPIAMGAGAIMEASRDGILDSLNMLTSEAMGNDDYEEWEKTKERFGTASDLLDEGPTGYNIAKATLGGLSHAVRMGYTGRAGQIVRQAEYGKISDSTPATGMINEAYSVLGEPFKHSLEDAPRQTSKALLEYIMLRSPVIGSFNQQIGKNTTEAIFNQPKNRGKAIEDIELSY